MFSKAHKVINFSRLRSLVVTDTCTGDGYFQVGIANITLGDKTFHSEDHPDSNNRIASLIEGSTDVVQTHSQFSVKVCPRILSFGSNSPSGTPSKSISLLLKVKYSPFSRALSWPLWERGLLMWS
jgi:hypothetical protein